MEIDKVYSKSRFSETKERYEEWWEHKNTRPLAGVAVKCRQPDLPKPKFPLLTQENCNDFHMSVNDILDAIEYEVCSYEYYGDSFPMFSLDCFGPGIVAAILGAELDNSTGSVWFHAPKVEELEDLRFGFSEDNAWFQRLKQLMLKSVERFEGRILLSMPDLSGILDILAVFRPGELLPMDLYDEPEEVQRLCRELYEAWMKIYWRFAEYLNMKEFGYTDWSSLWSKKPSYVIQEDFSYMISQDMFEEFVYPNLHRFCNDLDRTLYHMDGSGEIKHASKIAGLKKLGAVQWVPGAGNPTSEHYPELHRLFEAAGKNLQIPGQGLDKMLLVAEQLDCPNCLHHTMIRCGEDEKEKNLAYLKKLNII